MSSNYINDAWKAVYTVIKDNFPNCDVDIKPLEVEEISKPTILILYPRISRLYTKSLYNDQQEKLFRINIYCLADNSKGDGSLASSKIAGELDSWIEHNQFKFSQKGLRLAQVVSSISLEDEFDDSSEKISGYLCVFEGKIIV